MLSIETLIFAGVVLTMAVMMYLRVAPKSGNPFERNAL